MKRIYLEITNACNLNCPFCTQNKGQSFMSLKDIDDYTSQIKKYTDFLYLHVLGEPTLHPDFDKILDILDSKNMNLQLVTNGTLLYKYPDLLNHKCLRKLSISLHSVNHLNIDDTYFETIDKLILNNKINIELRFYDRNNLDEKLNRYLDSIYKKYEVKESKKKNSYLIKEKTYIYFDTMFTWPSLDNPIYTSTGKCHGLIDQIAILHDGSVTSCCLDTNGINSFGNLKKNSLKEILESDKYINALNDFKQSKLSLKLCEHCSFHLRFACNND